MKLLLSINHTPPFTAFHENLQRTEKVYEYASYKHLLFVFKPGSVDFINMRNGLHAADYEAAYLTGYLENTELASATATVLDSIGVRYADSQLADALSTSKLTEYARLAAAGIPIPLTYAGRARILAEAVQKGMVELSLPLIIKRADADRGIDNYCVATTHRLLEILEKAAPKTVWIVQEYIPNDGFYRLSFYGKTFASAIFRSVHVRKDGNTEKTHLNKPKGGVNATLQTEEALPAGLITVSRQACQVMKREFAGVDALVHAQTGKPYILEVNYNPQLTTVQAFSMQRADAFLTAMKDL